MISDRLHSCDPATRRDAMLCDALFPHGGRGHRFFAVDGEALMVGLTSHCKYR